MAKKSLLDMVQNILNAMDADPVNSISDTVESLQVAEFVREAFEDLMSQREWAFLRTYSQLTGLGDTGNPTTMQIPDGINVVYWIKYNKSDVLYLDPKDFKDMIDGRNTTNDNVDANGFVTDQMPQYWTSFDDKYVTFDSYDSATESTLTSVKSYIYGVKVPTFTMSDTFIPDIPEKFFPTLLAEAKSTCFINLKQQSNVREERKAQRGRVMLRNEAWKAKSGEPRYNSNVDYGRKR